MQGYYNIYNPYLMSYTTDYIFNNPYYNPYLPNNYNLQQTSISPVQSNYMANQPILNSNLYTLNNRKKAFSFSNWYSTNKEQINKFMKGAFIAATVFFACFSTLRATRFIQPSQSDKISNFHTVSAFSKEDGRYLYRGARPNFENDDVIKEFKEKNIKLVVDFRNSKSSSKEDMDLEKEIFEKNGIKYINFPMESGDIPSEKEFNKFQEIIKKHKKNGSIFIHCKSGIDRTGVMSAMYQMKNNGKSKQQAYEIMKDCGYNIYHQLKYKKLTKFMQDK